MGWRDSFRKPSFRGIEFNLNTATGSIGKRLAKHVILGRDGHYPEEMGRKPIPFTISGNVVGQDYIEQRDALIVACDKDGPGVLVVPDFGEIDVICEDLGWSLNTKEGGMCRLSFSFTQYFEPKYPSAEVSPLASLREKAGKSKGKAKENFLSRYSIAGFPSFVATSAAEFVGTVADSIESSAAFLFGEASQIADLAVQLSDIRDNIDAIVGTPDALADALENAIDLLSLAAGTDKAAVDALYNSAVFGAGNIEIPTLTPSRQQINDNENALIDFSNSIAAVNASEVGSTGTYESRDDAIEVRNKIGGVLEDISGRLDDIDLYISLTDVKTDLINALPPENSTLPVIEDYTPATTLPALVIANEIYNDADRADEIVERNKIKNPCFVIGAENIKVLANA